MMYKSDNEIKVEILEPNGPWHKGIRVYINGIEVKDVIRVESGNDGVSELIDIRVRCKKIDLVEVHG